MNYMNLRNKNSFALSNYGWAILGKNILFQLNYLSEHPSDVLSKLDSI